MPSRRAEFPATFVRLLLAAANGGLTLAFYALVVHRYGVSQLTDCLFAIILVVNVVYTVTLGQLNEILVPYFLQLQEEANLGPAYWDLTAGVLIAGVLLAGATVLPLALVVPRIFPGVAAQSPALAWQLVILSCAYCVLFCAWTVKSCFLVARGRSSTMQLLLLLGNGSGVLWLACFAAPASPGQVVVAQLLSAAVALLVPVRGIGIGHYQRGSGNCHLADAYRRVRWLVVNAVICRAEPLFDCVIAASIGNGALTVFYLLQRMVGFTHAVVQNGYLLPLSACMAEQAHGRGFRRLLRTGSAQAVALTAALMAASAAAVLALNWAPLPAFRSFASMFQQHGLLLLLLAGYAAGIILIKIFSTVLYILRREYMYLQVSVTAFAAGLALKVAGARYFGLSGLALGTSAAALLAAACLYSAMVRVLAPTTGAKGDELPALTRERCRP